MVLITHSHESDYKRGNVGKIAHSKPFWAVIIAALFIVEYIAYPRESGPDDTDPNITPTIETVTDIDGNVYRTVKIGNQVWMAENLKTTRVNDGQSILYEPDSSNWADLRTPGYCWPNNDPSNKDDYGACIIGMQ